MRSIVLKSVAAMVIVAVCVSTCVGTARANVPFIVSVTNTSTKIASNNPLVFQPHYDVWLRVTISHENPNATHYVDLVEVSFLGLTKQFPLQNNQTSASFTVNLFVGRYSISEIELPNIPEATVRAHCTVHGWSDWSSGTPVPEFPVATIVAFIALATSLFAIRSKPVIRARAEPHPKQ